MHINYSFTVIYKCTVVTKKLLQNNSAFFTAIHFNSFFTVNQKYQCCNYVVSEPCIIAVVHKHTCKQKYNYCFQIINQRYIRCGNYIVPDFFVPGRKKSKRRRAKVAFNQLKLLAVVIFVALYHGPTKH